MSAVVRRLELALAVNAERGAGCWRWLGAKSSEGYPKLRCFGVTVPAHRLACALFHWPHSLEGRDVHHLCGVRECVNPEHLVPVTAAEHALIHRGCVPAPVPIMTFSPFDGLAVMRSMSPTLARVAERVNEEASR